MNETTHTDLSPSGIRCLYITLNRADLFGSFLVYALLSRIKPTLRVEQEISHSANLGIL